MTKIILSTIRLYQKSLSLLFQYVNPNHGCRFYPSCSEYSYQAIKKYGPIKGTLRGFKRIIKCHPFSKGGYDPC